MMDTDVAELRGSNRARTHTHMRRGIRGPTCAPHTHTQLRTHAGVAAQYGAPLTRRTHAHTPTHAHARTHAHAQTHTQASRSTGPFRCQRVDSNQRGSHAYLLTPAGAEALLSLRPNLPTDVLIGTAAAVAGARRLQACAIEPSLVSTTGAWASSTEVHS